MKTIYLTRRNADQNEGRGPMVNDAAFSTREAAAEYVDFRPGIQGRKAKWSETPDDWEIVPLVIFDSVEEANIEKIKDRREAALKKLTPEDRMILGIK